MGVLIYYSTNIKNPESDIGVLSVKQSIQATREVLPLRKLAGSPQTKLPKQTGLTEPLSPPILYSLLCWY